MGEKKKVLITGGDGFVGQHVLSRLANDNLIEVVASVQEPDKVLRAARTIQLDVTVESEVRRVIKTERPTHILHLAAVSSKGDADRNPRRTWNINVAGTQNIALALMEEQLPDCRFIFCGSSEVYGDSFRSEEALDETALLKPVTVYGATKAAADLMIGQMSLSGLRAIRVRPFNHIGPGQRPDFAVPAFSQQVARIERGQQKPIIRVGNLSVRRDFLDVRDVVSVYVSLINEFDNLPNGCVLNIASGQSISLQSILSRLLSFSMSKIEVEVDPQLLRQYEIPVMRGNAVKLQQVLGWKPQYDLDTTLLAALDYFRCGKA